MLTGLFINVEKEKEGGRGMGGRGIEGGGSRRKDVGRKGEGER